MSNEVARIEFPDMDLSERNLELYGYTEPDSTFIVEKDSEESYSVYYSAADEIIEGKSIKEVARKLRSFLRNDPVIKKTGKPVITIFKDKG